MSEKCMLPSEFYDPGTFVVRLLRQAHAAEFKRCGLCRLTPYCSPACSVCPVYTMYHRYLAECADVTGPSRRLIGHGTSLTADGRARSAASTRPSPWPTLWCPSCTWPSLNSLEAIFMSRSRTTWRGSSIASAFRHTGTRRTLSFCASVSSSPTKWLNLE